MTGTPHAEIPPSSIPGASPHTKRRRLAAALAASLVVHLLALTFFPPLFSRPRNPLKRPLWVDLMEVQGHRPFLPGDRPAAALPQPSPSTHHPANAAPKAATSPTASPRRSSPQIRPPRPESKPLPETRQLLPPLGSLLPSPDHHPRSLSFDASPDTAADPEAASRFEAYLLAVKDAVARNWIVSTDTDLKQGTTVIRIIVAPDGSLTSIDLLESSGMILHDYEAFEAVKQAFPFRPPPKTILDAKGRLAIRFSFHYLLGPAGPNG